MPKAKVIQPKNALALEVPKEIWLSLIISFFDINNILTFRRTCKFFNFIIKEQIDKIDVNSDKFQCHDYKNPFEYVALHILYGNFVQKHKGKRRLIYLIRIDCIVEKIFGTVGEYYFAKYSAYKDNKNVSELLAILDKGVELSEHRIQKTLQTSPATHKILKKVIKANKQGDEPCLSHGMFHKAIKIR